MAQTEYDLLNDMQYNISNLKQLVNVLQDYDETIGDVVRPYQKTKNATTIRDLAEEVSRQAPLVETLHRFLSDGLEQVDGQLDEAFKAYFLERQQPEEKTEESGV